MRIEKVKDENLQAEIEKLWLTCQSDFSEFINKWVTGNRELLVVSGFDDKDISKPLTYLILQEDSSNLAELAFEEAEVLKSDPEAINFIPPDMKTGRDEVDQEDFKMKESEYFQRREKHLGNHWDSNFGESICSLKSATTIALGYALSRYGEVTFAVPSEYMFEDMENPTYEPEEIIAIHAEQYNHARNFSRSENFVAVRNKD